MGLVEPRERKLPEPSSESPGRTVVFLGVVGMVHHSPADRCRYTDHPASVA